MSKNRIIIEAGKENAAYWKDVWSFRSLFYFLAWRDVMVRYKQTTIGIIWALLRPALTIAALSAVRMIFTDSNNEKLPIPLLIAAGTLPWQFFSSAFSDASNSLVANSNLISKIYFPRIIVPASTVIVGLIDFAVSFSIALGILFFYPEYLSWHLIAMPLFLILALLAAMGTGLYIAALNVKYRDFRYVIPFIVQFGMFISPVMYSTQDILNADIPQWLKYLYSLNPMVSVIDGFRWSFFGESMTIQPISFCISQSISVFFLILGVYTFRKMEKGFADII
jgi:lipopolysaccharide transport system permease protein